MLSYSYMLAFKQLDRKPNLSQFLEFTGLLKAYASMQTDETPTLAGLIKKHRKAFGWSQELLGKTKLEYIPQM